MHGENSQEAQLSLRDRASLAHYTICSCTNAHRFEIFAFTKYHDLEPQVEGNSRSLEMTPFDIHVSHNVFLLINIQ